VDGLCGERFGEAGDPKTIDGPRDNQSWKRFLREVEVYCGL